MTQFDIVTDLQYGSTGKGLLAGFLAEKHQYDTIVSAWSPNAGHTYINAEGEKFVNTAIPNGIVSNGLRRILLGPGSVINPDTLLAEIGKYCLYLDGVEILIHENATVVSQTHRNIEAGTMFAIGSTMKGVGAAVIDKIKRDPRMNIIARDALISTPLEGFVVSALEYNLALDKGKRILLEGAQGFSLSINQGFYPFTTSRDCTTHQLLSDCAIPAYIGRKAKVYGCARTYPIRVANRFKDGEMVGTSGPCYEDQREIHWSQLGMEPELTTVTQLPRRIFTYSHRQMADAVRMNGVDEVFLNFVNYIAEDRDEEDALQLSNYVDSVRAAGSKITMLGWGSSANDVQCERF
jgi:adenylosuccinate synthase